MPHSSRPRAMSRFWRDDEEMAKKDDDLRLPGHRRQSSHWQAARAPRRRFVGRVACYALLAFLVFFGFYRLLFSSSEGSVSSSAGRNWKAYQPLGLGSQQGQSRSRGKKDAELAARTYSGPIRLPRISESLYTIVSMGGKMLKNRNVLFAAASLRSASTLLPMACQMAEQRQNYVHFAFMGRSDIPMIDLLEINGLDSETCKVTLHDSRPDRADVSTELRMMIVSARALHHINMFMHPQAVVIDSTSAEEDYFLRGIRDQSRALRSALVELPEKPNERLAWITQLDASALSAWNKVHFDIVIHAPPTGSANLLRLLESVRRADLSVVSVPHLTIELPPVIDEPLSKYLFGFQWPPYGTNQPRKPQMLSLRHRIPRERLSEEESSARFLESFWPANPSQSHVLVLSPQTELSPQFFNYVKYSLLNYRYSSAATRQAWDEKLMAISLQSSATLLDSTTPLTMPQAPDGDESRVGSPFLWQGPGSDAVLFIGEKWVELHGYLSQLLEKQHAQSASPALLGKKEVSKKHPAWLKYVLQLCRLRGYFTLYPSPETAGAILGVHSDLFKPPEEYFGDDWQDSETNGAPDAATQIFDSGSQVNMLNTLPKGGVLRPLGELPLLSWDGKKVTWEELEQNALEYTQHFRRQVGECTNEVSAKAENDPHARDLFCNTRKSESATKEETP